MRRAALEIEGYEVIDAPDGTTALALAAAHRPHMAILDSVLPDMDGLDLLSEVRRREGADVPAIVIAGLASRLEEIRARSGGTTHVLAKPVEPSQLLEVVRAQLAPRVGRPRGQRILVVDDEPLNLKLAAFRLQSAGYEVERASSGEEALEIVRRRRPDAILTDVMMPSMDGFTFCREVRGDPALAGVPVILVSSAYVDDADRGLARHMGADALVVRTPDLHEAIAALEASLQGTLHGPPPPATEDVAALHRQRLQVQLERQTARNEALVRQAAIQATALSIISGLSEVLAQPRDVPHMLGDVLVHCLDAAGLSTGLLYVAEPDGRHRLQAQFGIPADRKADAEAAFGHPQLLRRIVQSGLPLALSAGAEDTDAEARDFLARLGHSSALVLPFVVLGEIYGELVLASESHDLSESSWIGFARSLALQFGQALALGHSIKRLGASEARMRSMLDAALDAVVMMDEQGRVASWNARAETLFGWSRDEAIGRILAELIIPPRYRERHTRGLARFLATGAGPVIGRRIELSAMRRDGSEFPVELTVTALRDGGAYLFNAFVADITERKRAEEALEQAQRRLEHVVTSSPAVLYSLIPQGNAFPATWISENVERLLGYTPREALHADWWPSNLHPEERDRIFAELPALLTNDHLAQEYRFQHKDGAYRWLRAELRLLRDSDGKPQEVVGSWSDITARKDVELKLQESEEQYRLLFDSNPYPTWVFDEESLAFLAANEAAVRHYGWTRGEFLRMRLTDIRPPEARDNPGVRHRKKDGTEIEVDVVATSITFQGRRARLILASDVTEKAQLLAQLVRAQKMEAVGQLAGGVAHDFNNLLGVITGYTELLMRELPADSLARKRSEEIKRAADRAAALTRQLLAFGRRQVLQPKVLDLNEVVAEVEKMLGRLISENIQIVTVAAPSLGRVRADAGQIEQVLMNLAINARDAMPSGGRLVIETGNVELDETYARTNPDAHPGPHVMLAVSDTGHGMDAQTMSRIFEPFFTTKEEGKGTGLGLATVYGIVRQSGGTVNVYSEPGRGTAFKVYLPRVEADIETAARVAPAAPLGGTETIVLVEDAEALRLLVRELLESAGYAVLDAEAPDKALSLVESTPGPIHLVLTDMVMPRMNGQELARRIAILKPEARVVFMSGYSEEAIGDQTLEPGTPFLQKPFTMDALMRTVRRALDAEPGARGSSGS